MRHKGRIGRTLQHSQGVTTDQAEGTRDKRAALLIHVRNISHVGFGVFSVESSMPGADFKVEVLRNGQNRCSCPDYKKHRGRRCKHIRAVELMAAATGVENAWEAEVGPMTAPTLPPGMSLNEIEHLYNNSKRRPAVSILYPSGPKESTRIAHAHKSMRRRGPELMRDLCMLFVTGSNYIVSNNFVPVESRMFALLVRVFLRCSIDDAVSEMGTMAKFHRLGMRVPCKNSISTFYHDPNLTPLLREALTATARVVRKIETMALVDSSGFATTATQVYLDNDRGRKVIRSVNRWKKAHVVCGGLTSVIADVIITDHEGKIDESNHVVKTADVNFFGPLVRSAHAVWDNLEHALADKAYLSGENILVCEALKLVPIIAVKINWNPDTKTSNLAQTLYKFYTEMYEEFHEIYRYRSKIEGVFSGMKRTTGAFFRSRGTRALRRGVPLTIEQEAHAKVAFENELLVKCIAHNVRRIVVLEHLHDERVKFSANTAFTPIPVEWLYHKTAVVDLELSEDGFDEVMGYADESTLKTQTEDNDENGDDYEQVG